MALLVAGAAPMLLAGCGGDGDEGESGEAAREQVKRVVRTYLDARDDGDGETACAQLTERGQEDLVEAYEDAFEVDFTDCAQAIEVIAAAFEGGSEDTSTPISGVRIDGERAAVTVEGVSTAPRLIRRDGEWLIDSGHID